MNIFERGKSYLTSRLLDIGSKEVVYVRGSNDLVLRSVIGSFTFRVQDSFGMVTYSRSRDYIVQRSDFVPVFNTPIAGDVIVERIQGKVKTYEVMAPNGEQHWRWSDEMEIALRIHTQLIDEVDDE